MGAQSAPLQDFLYRGIVSLMETIVFNFSSYINSTYYYLLVKWFTELSDTFIELSALEPLYQQDQNL